MKKPLTDEEKQARLPYTIPEKMMLARWDVCLIGAGGTGSQVIGGLARMNHAMRALGHPGMRVCVFDDDVVSEASVGRQLFSRADIGQPKANVLVHRVNQFYGTDWTAKIKKFAGSPRNLSEPYHWYRNSELTISCTDTGRSRRDIYKILCESGDGLWLDFGNGRDDGQVVLGEVGYHYHGHGLRLPTVMDLFPELRTDEFEEDPAPSCSVAEALQHQELFTNQGIATLGLDLIWRLYRKGAIKTHGYFMNLESGQAVGIPIVRVASNRK